MIHPEVEIKVFSGSGGGGSSTPQRTPDNLLSQDYVEILLGVVSGPIKGLVSDAAPHGPLENLFFGDTPLQNIADQKSNFADFKVTQYFGRDDDPEIKRVLGGDASNLAVNTHLLQNIAVIRTTPPNLRKTVDFPGLDRLEVRILFNTIAKQDDKGTFDATAHFRLSYKASNSPIWLDYNGQADTSVTGKTTTGYVKDFLIPVEPLTNSDYDVRLIKLSPDNGTETAIDFTWESLQMVTLGKPKYLGLAMLHMFGKVTAQFNSIPDISGIYDLQIVDVPTNYNPETRTYDETVPWNGSFKKEWTNNPAWVLWWLVTNTEKGLARYYPHIAANRNEFYKAAKWCDEQVPSGVVGVTQPRFTFNEVFTEQRLGLELLTYVAGAFNSTLYDSGNGVIRLKTDQITTPTMIFTPENVSEGGFNYSFTDITTRYNDITVQFINPAFNWNTDERAASIDTTEWIEQNGRIPLDFVAVGCTDVHEAIRRANDRVLTANTEITQVSFETTRFGGLCELYDVIYIADPDSGWSTGGRIKSYANGIIQLRDPIFFESLVSVNLKIQTYSGIVELGVTPPSLGLVYSLTVVSGQFPVNVPEQTVFTVENDSNLGLAKPFRVAGITEVEGKPDKYAITAIEMNPNKYPDSANGTVSDPIVYDFVMPGEPVLPIILNVQNLIPQVTSDGTLIYRALASWSRPNQAYTEYYELEVQEKGTSIWELYKVYGEEQEVKPLKDGVYYNLRLWAVTPTGMRSSKALQVNNFLVAKKNSILENVTGLTLSQTNKGWQASWNQPTGTPDLAGTRIKFSNPPKTWEELPNLYLSPSLVQDLPWFLAGTVRVHAKYINTTGNESSASNTYDLNVLAPNAPVVTISSSFGSNILTFTDPKTTQPLAQILVKKGNATSTYDNAAIASFTLGTNQRTFSVSADATQATRIFLRAVDVAGNLGAITQVEIPPGANSVNELLDSVKGDIDETWITPGLLDHINYGDPAIAGGLADQVNQIKKSNPQFDPYYTADWKRNSNTTDWIFYNGVGTLTSEGTLLNAGANDPIFRSPVLNFDGRFYDKIRVKIKRVSGTGWDGSVFYSNGNHAEVGHLFVHVSDTTILDQFVVIDWDMSQLPDWSSASPIGQVRFDFGVTSADDFVIEYISFGKYGVGLTQAEFNNRITVLANQDTAFTQQLTTLSSTISGKVGDVLNLDPFCTNLNLWAVNTTGNTAYAVAVILNDGISGTTAFSLRKPQPGGGGGNSIALLSKPMRPSVGKTYRLSLWVRKVAGDGGFYSRLHFYDAAGNFLQYLLTPPVEFSVPALNTWTKLTGNGTAPAGAVSMEIVFTSNYTSTIANAETQVQDIRLEDITDTLSLTALVQTEATTRADQTGFLGANWTTRVALTLGGVPVIGGISLAGYSTPTQGPTFDMSIRSNKVAFLPPAGLSSDIPTYPFVYYTTATVLPSGITVQPGIYTKNAFIEYVTADQIDTRGLNVKDYSGNILFGVNTPLASSRIIAASNWLNENQLWSQVVNKPQMAGNLVIKPSFEDTLIGTWAGGGNVNAPNGLSSNPATPWKRCLGVINRDNFEYLAEAIPTREGDKFYVEGDGYTGGSPYLGMLGVAFLNADFQYIAFLGSSAFVHPFSGWTHVKGEVTAPAGSVYARFWIQIEMPGGTPNQSHAWANLYMGRTAAGATVGATFGVNVFGKITPGNASTFIDNAAINYAMIQYILASQIQTTSLSAISANIGFLTSRSGGAGAGFEQDSTGYRLYNSANQLMYDLQTVLGAVTLRVGLAGGSNMFWNGSKLQINNADFDTFTATIPGGNVDGGNQQPGYGSYGFRTVSVSGGRAPYSYMWFTQMTAGNYSSQLFCTSGAATTHVGGTGTGPAGVINTGYLNCIVTDANGRVTATKVGLTANHAASDSGGGGGDGGV